MVTRTAVDMALRAFDARDDALVLDLVSDSDIGELGARGTPRRMRFTRNGKVLDVLAHESGSGVQLLLRLEPAGRYTVHVTSRRVDLGVGSEAVVGTSHSGVARIAQLPRGLTSLRFDGSAGQPPLRMAWIRL